MADVKPDVADLNWLDEDDDFDDNGGNSFMWGGKRAFVFLIDATQPMFDTDVNDISYFEKCIDACKSFMLDAIYKKRKDFISVVVFGTNKNNTAKQYNQVTVVQDLEEPNAEKIKELIKIANDPEEFRKEHGHSTNFSLAEVLWDCQKLISNCKNKLSEKAIFLLTNSDNPHANDKKLQHDARTRASDIAQVEIKLRLIPLGLDFCMDHFYKELIEITVRAADEDEYFSILANIDNPVEQIEDILKLLSQRCGIRTYSRIPWTLGKDLKLAVGVYGIVTVSIMPTKQKMEQKQHTLVQSKPQYFENTTGEEVFADEIKKMYETRGEKIHFEQEEFKTINRIQGPGIVLLGFKPTSRVKRTVHADKCYFIYPEDRLIKGSRKLFAALHERCLARNVSAICYLTARRNASPKLVALVPQEEKLKNKTQLEPPGFIAVPIPYADSIRDLDDKIVQCQLPDPELLSLAKEIMKKVSISYTPLLFDNPKRCKMWWGIEATVLGYQDPISPVDYTKPDKNKIDGKIGDLAKQFMELAFPSGFRAAVSKRPASRPGRPADDAGAKRRKVDDFDINNMAAIAQNRLVEKFTVAQLKTYLQNEGVSVTGMKKPQLVEAVYQHLKAA